MKKYFKIEVYSYGGETVMGKKNDSDILAIINQG